LNSAIFSSKKETNCGSGVSSTSIFKINPII
jgi:hypothetical protein